MKIESKILQEIKTTTTMNWFSTEFLQNASVHFGTLVHKTSKETLAKKYMFFNNLMREYKEEKFTYECSTQEEFNFIVASHSKINTSLPELMSFIYYADKLEYAGLASICDTFIKAYDKSTFQDKFKSVSIAYQLYDKSFHTCPPVTKGWVWNDLLKLNITVSAYEHFQLLDNVPVINQQNDVEYGKGRIILLAIKHYDYLMTLVRLYCVDDVSVSDIDSDSSEITPTNFIGDKLVELFSFRSIGYDALCTTEMVNLYKLLRYLHTKYPNDKNLDKNTKKIIGLIASRT